MEISGWDDLLFKEYLKILGLRFIRPDLKFLREVIVSHQANIPFENISKLYYKAKYNLHYIPTFEQYIEGIKEYHFGGTCYSNNYYLNKLLKYLGYDIILCGADMSNPDVHIVSIARIENREFLIDVGFASPFLEPLPRDLSTEYEINYGNDKYVLLPKDNDGKSCLVFYKKGTLQHGYTLKPNPRSISEFDNVIKASFDDEATFMNNLLVAKFGIDYSVVIRNFSMTEYINNSCEEKIISGKDELIAEIGKKFCIPEAIIEESLSQLNNFTI